MTLDLTMSMELKNALKIKKNNYIKFKLPMLNHSVVGMPVSSLACDIASLIARATTTDMHIGGSPTAEKDVNNLV